MLPVAHVYNEHRFYCLNQNLNKSLAFPLRISAAAGEVLLPLFFFKAHPEKWQHKERRRGSGRLPQSLLSPPAFAVRDGAWSQVQVQVQVQRGVPVRDRHAGREARTRTWPAARNVGGSLRRGQVRDGNGSGRRCHFPVGKYYVCIDFPHEKGTHHTRKSQ